jgi:hypothetical protein
MLVLCIGLFLTDQRSLAGRILAVFLATGLLEFAMKTWLPQVPVPEEAARSTDPSPHRSPRRPRAMHRKV